MYKRFFSRFQFFVSLKKKFLPLYLKFFAKQIVTHPTFPASYYDVNYNLCHTSDLAFSSLDVSEQNDFYSVKNVTVLSKSRLFFDTEEKMAFYDIGESTEHLKNLLKDYVLHDELFKIIRWDEQNKELQFSSTLVLPSLELKGTWISLTHHGSENWMHWISEILPKVMAGGRLIDEDIGIIVDSNLPKTMYESLSLLLPKNCVVITRPHTSVLVETLLVPKKVGYTLMWERVSADKAKGVWFFDPTSLIATKNYLVSNYCSDQTVLNNQNIYLRRKSSFRKIKNESYVHISLRKLGFFSIFTNKMSLKEQINTFNSAKLLVTQAGAALANIMFMPEKSHVIVIAANSKYLHYAYFEEWANLFDVSLEYLKSVSKSEEPYKKDMVFSVNHPVNQDVFCNINNLINLIQRKVFHD